MLAQITHRFMFDTGGDDVAPGRVLLQKTTDRPVVGLGAARGEDNLAGVLCAQQVRDLCARVFDRVAHSATELIGGRWIAVERCQVRLHRLEYFRGYAGGRVVVQVNHFRVQASKYIATPRFTKRSQRFGTVVNLKSSADYAEKALNQDATSDSLGADILALIFPGTIHNLIRRQCWRSSI